MFLRLKELLFLKTERWPYSLLVRSRGQHVATFKQRSKGWRLSWPHMPPRLAHFLCGVMVRGNRKLLQSLRNLSGDPWASCDWASDPDTLDSWWQGRTRGQGEGRDCLKVPECFHLLQLQYSFKKKKKLELEKSCREKKTKHRWHFISLPTHSFVTHSLTSAHPMPSLARHRGAQEVSLVPGEPTSYWRTGLSRDTFSPECYRPWDADWGAEGQERGGWRGGSRKGEQQVWMAEGGGHRASFQLHKVQRGCGEEIGEWCKMMV